MARSIIELEARECHAKQIIDASHGWQPCIVSESALVKGKQRGIRVPFGGQQGGSRKESMPTIEIPLVLDGDYQAENAMVAYSALMALRNDHGWDQITSQSIRVGFALVKWPGRLSLLQMPAAKFSSPPATIGSCSDDNDKSAVSILADGAHNHAAAIALRAHVEHLRSVSGPCRPVCWVLGFTREGISRPNLSNTLVDEQDQVWFVPFTPPYGMPWIKPADPDSCLAILQSTKRSSSQDENPGPNRMIAFPSLEDALSFRSQQKQHDTTLTVVCGSLYLVADLYRILDIKPWDEWITP